MINSIAYTSQVAVKLADMRFIFSSNTSRIDVKNICKGVYLLKVVDDKGLIKLIENY